MRDLSKEDSKIKGLLKELFPNVKTYDEDSSNLVAVLEEEPEEVESEQINTVVSFEEEKITPQGDRLRYFRAVKDEVEFFYNTERGENWSKERVREKAYEVAGNLRKRIMKRGGLSKEGKVISLGTIIYEVLGYLRATEK